MIGQILQMVVISEQILINVYLIIGSFYLILWNQEFIHLYASQSQSRTIPLLRYYVNLLFVLHHDYCAHEWHNCLRSNAIAASLRLALNEWLIWLICIKCQGYSVNNGIMWEEVKRHSTLCRSQILCM
jgi:hypothetical protein